jgi:hypothetical protein
LGGERAFRKLEKRLTRATATATARRNARKPVGFVYLFIFEILKKNKNRKN